MEGYKMNEDKYKYKKKALRAYFLFLGLFLHFIRKKPFYVLKENWNYLILLDACRYDYFKKYNNIKGKLEKKISPGAMTWEWVMKNFPGYYEDIVYISSTPCISQHQLKFYTNAFWKFLRHKNINWRGINHFYKIEPVWDYGWNDKLGTVHPREVNKAALKAIQKYPDKRMVIHYLQPHGPWIGEDGFIGEGATIDTFFEGLSPAGLFTNAVQFGDNASEIFRKAYIGNLKLVLKYVKELIPHLKGKIVVTADHGETLGEKGIFSHPEFVYVKELVEVPWLVIEK
jgi:hypothetical protein